jgi:hypothetical protein
MGDEFGLHALSARLRAADTLWDVYVLWEAYHQASAKLYDARPKRISFDAPRWYHNAHGLRHCIWSDFRNKIAQLLEALPSNNLPPIPWKHLDTVKRILKEFHDQDEWVTIFPQTRSLHYEDVKEAVENWSSPSFEG